MIKKITENEVPVNNANGPIAGVSQNDPTHPLAKNLGMTRRRPLLSFRKFLEGIGNQKNDHR